MAELVGSKRGKNSIALQVGDIDATKEVTLTLGLSGPRLPGPDKFVGQTMTLEELGDKFGAWKEGADKAAELLNKNGLEVKEVSLPTRSMRVSGTAEAVQAVFQPEQWTVMRSHVHGMYFGREGKLYIPDELTGIITGAFGLDQRPMSYRRSGTAAWRASSPRLKPSDIEKLYNFPPGCGEGQSIAIAQFGGCYLDGDIDAYFKTLEVPPPNIQLIPINDAPYMLQDLLAIPDPTPRRIQLEESCEVTADVEIIGGLCPKANISIYFSKFDERGWVDLLDRVITARPLPVALSISWGSAEDAKDDEWTPNGIQAINDRLNLARLLGITTCVASGDDGCRNLVKDGRAHVDFPSSSPHVLAVGGTMLEESGEEVAWWDNPDGGEGATGGGVSRYFPCPAWQKNVAIASVNPNPRNKDGRVVPDVSALAGKPYYDLVLLNLPWPGGQTSASAPLWAALIARINANLTPGKRQRFLTPLLYKELANGMPVGKASCRDITTGHNECLIAGLRGYHAGPGFDAVTGWGVPNGVELLNCLERI